MATSAFGIRQPSRPTRRMCSQSSGGDAVEICIPIMTTIEERPAPPIQLTMVKILFCTIEERPAPPIQLTMAKILFCFQSEEGPPLTWCVLACDYVEDGEGDEHVPDFVTSLPVLLLRGRAALWCLFPVATIRRKVLKYQLCS